MEVPLSTVADTMTVIFEGAFVMSKTLKDPRIVSARLTQYRNYLALLFRAGT